MNKVEMLTKLNTKIARVKIKGKKYSPEIMMALGIAGAITGTVLACVATTKLDTIKEKKHEELESIHENIESLEPQKIKQQTTAVYLKTGVRYASIYAPAIVVTGLSLSCMVASNVILRKRLIGVSAAYAMMTQTFKEYRGRVTDRYGAEIEKEIRYNIQQKEIAVDSIDKKGNVKSKIEKIKVMDPNSLSDFARVYDDGNMGWSKDPQSNLSYLKCQQAACNEKLKRKKYVFLNEVYLMLGFPVTKAGQVVGWVYRDNDPEWTGDNFIDFGIFDVTNEKARDFVNGYERNLLLDFNVDGNILDLI